MSSTRGPASRRISDDVDASSSFCSAACTSAASTLEESPPPVLAADSTEPGSCASRAGLTYCRKDSSAAYSAARTSGSPPE